MRTLDAKGRDDTAEARRMEGEFAPSKHHWFANTPAVEGSPRLPSGGDAALTMAPGECTCVPVWTKRIGYKADRRPSEGRCKAILQCAPVAAGQREGARTDDERKPCCRRATQA